MQQLPREFLWPFGNQVSCSSSIHPPRRGEEVRGQSFPSSSLKSMRNWWFCCFCLLEGVGSLISNLPLEAPGCKSEHETDDVSPPVVGAGRSSISNKRSKGLYAFHQWPLQRQMPTTDDSPMWRGWGTTVFPFLEKAGSQGLLLSK